MSPILRATRAELLKVRRTRALWLALGAPLTVVALLVLLVAVGAVDPSDGGVGTAIQTMLVLWAMLMLPLYTALETALVNAIDHDSSGWTHLFALPVPRWSVHLAKLLVSTGLVALSSALLAAGLFGVVLGLRAAGVETSDLARLGQLVAAGASASYVGALAIIAAHHALSIRLRGFEWPIGIGMAATIVATQAGRSADYWAFLPWDYPVVAVGATVPGDRFWAMGLSAALAITIAVASAYDTMQRDVH